MLKITALSKKFQHRIVVDDINLHVQNGEFLSILGPSGCGKTTLLRLIAGHEFAESGKILLDGEDITTTVPFKRDIHTVFQRYALFPHMNVYDNIAFGLRCSKTPESEIKKRIEEMLEIANLKGYQLRPVTKLSGGEQQRVALVRALINMPKLLLLDEPLGALDFKLRIQLQQDLVAIQKRVKTTFVFVTHDQQEALNMSDRIAIMNHGKIEQIGTPTEIYETPKTFFTADFIGGINKLNGVAKADDGKCQIQISNGTTFSSEKRLEGNCVLCVRPEKIAITKTSPSNPENVLRGTVRSQTYLGTHTEFEVDIESQIKMLVFRQNRGNEASIRSGEKVYLSWPSHAAHLFQRNP